MVKTVLNRVLGEDIYYSPTDMGVNMVGLAITDDEVVREAACQEIVRRWFKASCDARLGLIDDDIPQRIAMIMQQLELTEEIRPVVARAREKAAQRGVPAIAFQLPDGRITTGRDSCIMSAAASGVINAIKALAHINDNILLLSQNILDPIIELKREKLHVRDSSLSLSDVLVALSVCSITNHTVSVAFSQLELLRGCEAHCTVLLSSADEEMLRRLGVNVTCDPASAYMERRNQCLAEDLC